MKLFNPLRIYKILPSFEQKIFILLTCVGLVGIIGLFGSVYRGMTVEVPAEGGEIVEGVVGHPTNLNPIQAPQTDADHDVRALVHAGLLGVDSKGNLKPELAEKLPEISKDLKTYTVTLKENIFWQDGQPITADDVIYTVSQIQSKENNSYLRNSFKFVKVEKVDERTVTFTLREPVVTFSENLLAGLLPSHLYGQYDNLKPVGAGPYRIEKLVYNGGEKLKVMQLKANQHYKPNVPYIKDFTIKFFDTKEQLAKAYKNRDVKSFGKLSDKSNIIILSSSELFKVDLPQYQAVFLNQDKDSILGNINIRRALRLATDRSQIVKTVYNSQAIAIGGPTVGQITVPPPEQSLGTAKKLLDEEGWIVGENGIREKEEQTLSITIFTNNIDINYRTAELVKEQWQEIGVKTEVQALSNQELFKNIINPREYQALILFENIGHDPDPFPFWHSSQAVESGLNFTMLRNNDIDDVIIQARSTIDKNKRTELYEKFTDLVNEQSPAVFLVQPLYLYIQDSKVKNITFERIVIPAERFANIHKWYIKTGRDFQF